MTHNVLLADIGGTNARFAIANRDNGEIRSQSTLAVSEFSSITDAILHFYETEKTAPLLEAVLAIAGPTTKKTMRLSNSHWTFDCDSLRRDIQCKNLTVVNDFTALALGIPRLKADQYEKLFGQTPIANTPKLILGPGTGLGVSGLIPNGNQWTALSGEGGHASWYPTNSTEEIVYNALIQRYGHASFERIASGQGLRESYQILSGLAWRETPFASEISLRALEKRCEIATQSLSMFCSALGLLAGNTALALGALGGIYLAGGITPKIKPFLLESDFRRKTIERGRFDHYMQNIPVYLIHDGLSALQGCHAAIINTPLGAQVSRE